MTKDQFFNTKVALITGASRGIGFAIAEKLSAQNVHIIATCTSPKQIPELEEKLSKNGMTDGMVVALDVRNEEQIHKLSQTISDRFGKLDFLINCAGIMEKKQCTVETEKSEMWDEVMDINLKGTFLMCKYMIPLLKASREAHIINMSGGLGSFNSGMKGGTLPAYRISKTGVNALSLILSEELIEDKITVNSLDPGWVRTDLGGEDAPKSPEEAANEILQVLEHSFDHKKTGSLIKEGLVIPY